MVLNNYFLNNVRNIMNNCLGSSRAAGAKFFGVAESVAAPQARKFWGFTLRKYDFLCKKNMLLERFRNVVQTILTQNLKKIPAFGRIMVPPPLTKNLHLEGGEPRDIDWY